MDDQLNEKEFLEKIKSNMKKQYENIDEMFDLVIERIESIKKIITKFEESVKEYEYDEYKPTIMTNEEIKRVKKFDEVVKEIVGL
jgi:DNA-binding ferritin-like protein